MQSLKKTFLSSLLLLSIASSAFAQGYTPYALPDESKILKALNAETDVKKKKELEEKLIRECPFKKNNSELDGLANEAINLQLAANVPDNKLNECRNQLKDFSDSVAKTQDLQTRVTTSTGQFDPEDEKTIQDGVRNTQIAANAFNNLLQSGCEFKNNSKNVSNIGNQLITLLDAGSNVLAYTDPTAGLIAAAASISGRLVITLSKWLFENKDNQVLAKEATDSRRFINDLCLFRTLAYKYDDLYINPLEDPNMQLLERQVRKNRAAKATEAVRQCVNRPENDSLSNLVSFSNDLKIAVKGEKSQEQCIGILNKHNANMSAEGPNHVKNLAASYNCPTPAAGSPQSVISFCKVWGTIQDMSTGDIFEKCESEDFQKLVTAKFTSLANIILVATQESAKVIAKAKPINPDDVQRLLELEKEEKLAVQRYATLESILSDSPLSHVNTAKSMTALGRTILGDRFDDFSEMTMKSSLDNLTIAKESLNDLEKLRKKALKEKTAEGRAIKQQDVCTGVAEVRSQLAITYQSGMGVKEICDFMKGEGIPALKSQGRNFDNYSFSNEKKFGIFKKENYLSDRCEKIEKKIQLYFTEVNAQSQRIEALGCY